MNRASSQPYDVRGRTVFITGAARGIGAGAAERLISRGANVALVGLEPERLQALATRLGDRAAAFEADVSDPEALERAVTGAVERFGGIDVAIANAGLQFNGALATAPREQVERVFAVNFLGVWRTDRAVLEQIVRSTSGTLSRHRAALAMLQNDWSYFAVQPRFGYLREALREIERIWITKLELGIQAGVFRADLDPRLTYRLLRDVLWIPAQWRRAGGYRTDQVVDAFLRLLFDGITS